MFLEVIGFFIVFTLLISTFIKRTYNYWKRKGIDSVPGIFPFGSLKESLLCKKTVGRTLWDIYRSYNGKFIGFYAPFEPMLLIKDPEISKIIHVKEFNKFADNGFVVERNVDPMIAINPFAIKGIPEWRIIRAIHTPVQTTAKLRNMIPEMAKKAENLVKYIGTKCEKPIEVKDTTRFYTNDVVASCAYGIQSDSFFEESSFNKYTMKQMFGTDYSASYAIICGLFLPLASRLFRFRTISERAQKFFESLAKTSIKHREESGQIRNDLIQQLMILNKKNEEKNLGVFSDVEMAAHCMTFFIDGAETASIQLTFTLFELAVNEDKQEKLRKEIKEAVNDINEFDYEKLWSLPYLEMVITESLRLHPPVPFVSRTCIQKTELDGLMIEPGTKIFSSIIGYHRDAKYYPEPDKFIPERFAEENKFNLNKDTFIPFGEGPRKCLGAKFAQTENKMALVAILLNYRVTLAESTQRMNYDVKSTFFTAPEGKINLKFVPL